jgi:ACS family sodium-dependent inorganic phosphate cotransporter-like MFS transporter 5
MAVGSAFTITIPLFANLHWIAAFCCLFVVGFSFGAFIATVHGLWAYWAPLSERSRIMGIYMSGPRMGNIVGLLLGSYLCVNGPGGGWPSIFYVFGGLGVIWSAVFFLSMSDSPANHKFISEKEKTYIQRETKKTIEQLKYCENVIFRFFCLFWVHEKLNSILFISCPIRMSLGSK